MKRRLFYLLASVSLLLWLGCVFTWAHSYFSLDDATCVARHSGHFFCIAIESFHGVAAISVQHQTPQSMVSYSAPNGWEFKSFPSADMDLPGPATRWHGIAVGYHSEFAYASLFSAATPGFDDHLDHHDQTRWIWFPEYVPTLLLTAANLFALKRIRRRRKLGMCRNCGYDLRATPNRCPECGNISELVNTGK